MWEAIELFDEGTSDDEGDEGASDESDDDEEEVEKEDEEEEEDEEPGLAMSRILFITLLAPRW